MKVYFFVDEKDLQYRMNQNIQNMGMFLCVKLISNKPLIIMCTKRLKLSHVGSFLKLLKHKHPHLVHHFEQKQFDVGYSSNGYIYTLVSLALQ